MFPSSLVKLQEEYGYGPGWLHLSGRQANVFGLSQSVLKRSNICALQQPLHFKLEGLSNRDQASLGEWLKAIEAPPVRAFQEANSILLSRWLPYGFRIISLDDDFARELLIEHLQLEDGLVRRLLSPKRWLHFQELLQGFERSRPKAWLRHGTSMLWSVRKGRLCRLRFDGRFLVEEETGRMFQATPDALIKALCNRELYPSLFLTYALCSLLLRVKLAGGVRQIVYMPGFWSLFGQLLDPSYEDEREFLTVYPLVPVHGWGLGVVQPKASDLLALISNDTSNTAFQGIAEREYELTLGEASAGFSFISQHPLLMSSLHEPPLMENVLTADLLEWNTPSRSRRPRIHVLSPAPKEYKHSNFFLDQPPEQRTSGAGSSHGQLHGKSPCRTSSPGRRLR
ncbi:hypothetical protein AJ88_24895 [Mesorhizobium amorphae CCBAU 01583]|nr:hypothetical protein AJ88_24895 [Mesorhizobium amorphae CCBAU 01583]